MTGVQTCALPIYGFTVIDGDDTDLRFLDPQNVVVGLRGKGKATKGEHGGFVVNIQPRVA